MRRLLPVLCAVQAIGCLTPPPLAAPDTAASAGVAPHAPEKMTELDAWAAVPLMAPGFNIGNTLENTTSWETGWGNPPITKEFVESLARLGFKTVRLPVAWDTYAVDERIQPEKFRRVGEVVDWITGAGMFCVLNIHWDGGWIDSGAKEKFPTTFATFSADAERKFRSYWEQIAGFFAGKNEKLIFEALNEETNFSKAGSTDKAYATLTRVNQLFIDTVRKTGKTGGHNARRLLIVAGYNTDIEKTCAGAYKLPKDTVPGRLFISVHYYTPYQFAGLTEDAPWGKMMTSWGTADDVKQLEKLFDMMKGFCARNDIPAFIGEFGVSDKKESASRVRWLSSVANAALSRGMVPVLWDVGHDVSRVEPCTASPDLVQVLRSLTPARVPAPPPPPEAAPAAAGGDPGVSPYIVVDQFGYLPDGEKIAVIRDPQVGFDASASFTPGATYALVNAATGARVHTAAPTAWNGGATDPSSGDKAWWFTFTPVTTPGDYYVLDVQRNVRSYAFTISDKVYREVLKQAARMLFYQRAGQDKDAAHAGAGWTDGPSFAGPLQDHHCRLYSDRDNTVTERDLWGGWYDAGDLNKYTSWTAAYVENLLRAYAENPAIWTDDYDIPESGNGIPDVLDEAMWGLAFLARMQGADGSVLSIVGEPAASPPSAATGPSLYGPATTSATFATAGAFAFAARILRVPRIAALDAAAGDFLARAKNAWTWAIANPAVTFKNNDATSGSAGIGAGQQEPDKYGRFVFQFDAAAQLFAATGDAAYRTFVDKNFTTLHLIVYGNYVAPWDMQGQEAALDYAEAVGATPAIASAIRANYLAGAKSSGNLGAIAANRDPYLAYLETYVWGSNSTKANMGSAFAAVVAHRLDAASNADMMRAASRYLHYIHGTNPLSIVYLTNMYAHGAKSCANEMFHTWFADGSARWDRAGTSTFGPPPGYLTGGPTPSYDWDACCATARCGSAANNALCTSQSLSPPKGQPAQKSYKDFNTGWPLDSWIITEPSVGYQIAYIRLLSKFVR